MPIFQIKLQILGVPAKAEKDEVVKATIELKSSEIEDGYTTDVIVSRQVSDSWFTVLPTWHSPLAEK